MLLVPIVCALLIILYAAGMRTSLIVFLTGAVLFCVSTTLSVLYFISDDITGAGITEATLFHLLYGFEGLELANFGTYAAAAAIGVAAMVSVCWGAWKICSRQTRQILQYQPSRIVHLAVIGALSIFAVGVHPAAMETIDVAQEFYDNRYGQVLTEELKPIDIQPPAKAKSLVYLYAESLERTFFDQKLFPGLIHDLTKLEKTSLSIRGIGQSPLTDWTIAGMVASQCGMPLATFRHNRNHLEDWPSFIPGATCIGDVLNASGYELAYVGGADLNFAGKGRFYRDHHFEDVTGLQEFRAKYGEDIPVSKWGIYDDQLFDEALTKFRQLSSSGKPFALFLLTLDTHAPLGHATPACTGDSALKYGDGASHMLNSVKCADRLIPQFVQRVQAEAGDDVVVVVASDHWQMRSDAAEPLSRSSVRENLFLVRGAGIKPSSITKPSTTMDIAPTILSLLGWDISSFALGRNLLQEEPTLVEKFGRDQYYDMVKSWRMNLWKVWEGDSETSGDRTDS